jgi:lipopolysaccharide heptosyltransferase II
LNPSGNSGLGGEAERILVIRFSSLGDILLTAPAIRALRARFPQGTIDLLVAREYADAAGLIPGPDRVLTFDRSSGLSGLWRLRRELSHRHTLLVDLQNSPRSLFLRMSTFPAIRVKAKRYRFRRWMLIRFKWNLYREPRPVPLRYLDALSMMGVSDDGRGLDLRVPESARAWADSWMLTAGLADRPMAVLCPGARHWTKQWPGERWTALGRLLVNDGFSVVIAGSLKESSLLSEIATAVPSAKCIEGQSIPNLAALFSRASVVVSNDSGLMHLAAGVGSRVVAIFGPTVESFGFYPFRGRSEVVERELPCRPCSAMGGERCPRRHFRCMLDIEPDSVRDAVLRISRVNPRRSL